MGIREWYELLKGKTESIETTLFGGDIHLHFHFNITPTVKREEKKE